MLLLKLPRLTTIKNERFFPHSFCPPPKKVDYLDVLWYYRFNPVKKGSFTFMDNKKIALGLTQILTDTINASCSATVKNNAIVVTSYYEEILKMLNEHDDAKDSE